MFTFFTEIIFSITINKFFGNNIHWKVYNFYYNKTKVILWWSNKHFAIITLSINIFLLNNIQITIQFVHLLEKLKDLIVFDDVNQFSGWVWWRICKGGIYTVTNCIAS